MYSKIFAFFFTLLLLAVVLYLLRQPISELLIPWLKCWVRLLESRFDIGEFIILQPENEYFFHLRLISQSPVEIYGRQLPYMDVSASTLVTHGLQHVYIISALMLVALFFTQANTLLLLLTGALALLLSLGLDIPFTLLGSIEGLLLENLAPEQLGSNLFVRWERFMTQGGRLAVAVSLGLLAVASAQKPDNR